MAIIVNLDVVLAQKNECDWIEWESGHYDGKHLYSKNGKAKAIRFSTLEKICQVLECQPGDLLTYKNDSNTIPEE